jgi:hypothetical protein
MPRASEQCQEFLGALFDPETDQLCPVAISDYGPDRGPGTALWAVTPKFRSFIHHFNRAQSFFIRKMPGALLSLDGSWHWTKTASETVNVG